MRKITGALCSINTFSTLSKYYKTKKILGLIICVFGISLSVAAAPSDLDPFFGNGGKVVSSPDGSPTFTSSGMALQSDGKIAIVGNRVVSGAYTGIIVARYNADGSLDTTFGNNGWTSVAFGVAGTDFELGNAVDVQSDGKIVIGGTNQYRVGNAVNRDFIVARFNLDGSLDTGFDGDGKLIISFNNIISTFYRENLSALKVAGNGKIVVGGVAMDATVDDRFVFAKINGDGSLDTSFGTNGKYADQSLGASNLDKLNDMVILPDGKIVIAGKLFNIVGNFRIAVKYNINGGREWTYTQGVQGTSSETEAFNGIAMLPDGKFIVVGKRSGKIAAFRLNADGTEDNTFINPTAMPNGQALKVVIQTDGKIVATISNTKFSTIRYNTNGSLDTSFGDNGFVNTSLSIGQDYSADVLVQPDGKILVGGTTQFGSPTEYYISLVRYKGTAVFPENPAFDYDGDGKADVSVFRPSNGVWYVNQSTNGFWAAQFGISTDRIVPSDYDGDGKTDAAIYRDGTWWILQSVNNVVKTLQFGLAEDKPQAGDFDNDGKDDLTVYRPSTGVWYILRSSDGGFTATQFGITEDIPQAADYDGDGKTDIAVFRPSTSVWYVKKSSGGELTVLFGSNGDRPTINDYDGDGKADIAVFRPSNGVWYISRSSDNQISSTSFGLQEDIPVEADYDGDGKADIAVFRPSTGVWYQLLSTSGFSAQVFGLGGDIPTPSAFNP